MENQLQPLHDAARRLRLDRGGRFSSDEGISGTKGRGRRPGLDALLKGVARREFDIVAAWSVVSAGPVPADLIGLLGEPRFATSTSPCTSRLSIPDAMGRMLFGMLGVFSQFGRAMIRAGCWPGWIDTVIGQAPGQAEDDAIPGAAHSSGIG